MSVIKQYVNKDGYRIRATEKVYNLYYKKQGFKPVADKPAESPARKNAEVASPNVPDQDVQEGADITVMNNDELKAFLIERGVTVKAKDTRKHLLELAYQLAGTAEQE